MATVVLASATQQQEQQETSAPATEQQPETINVNYFQRFDSGDYDIINYAILDDTSRYHYTDNNSLPLQYLEAKCFYAYNCTNTENMRVVIDSSGTDEVLADMCRLVNAPISNNPTREECINAFISAAMEHKAMKAARESQASASAPATTEQQAQQVQNNEPTLRDTLSKMTVKEIRTIARLVGVKNISKWSKSSLISRTSCMIHCAFDDIKATALKMTRENFMKIINLTDTEYLSLVLEELGYRSDLSREDCIKTFEEIFDNTNREAGRYDTLPHVEQEISEQEKERRQYEEFMQLDTKVKAAGTSCVLSTLEHFMYVNLLRQGFRQKHINDNEPTTSAPASTPEAFKINPDLAPDYDTAFDEDAYTPDYQPNRALLDDEPQPHRLIIKRRPAPAGRKLPTPKSRRQVYDFSKCADANTLRKALNTGDIDTIKAIAESYREFQPRTDGKTMTKKDYVTAIIRLYFPDYHPAPAKKSNAYTAEDLAQTRKILLAGEGGISFFTGMTRDQAKYELYHYSCGRGFFSLKELHLITKALGIKILPTKESMIYVLLNWMEDHGIISPNTDINHELKPDYDAAFDETAYSPDVQDVSVIVDDIPADHEPDIAPVSKPEREPWQEHTCYHCDHKPHWTHEQFIKGILLYYEYEDFNHKSHQERWIGAAEYLRHNYSLVQLWKLAKFFGLSIPKIKLTGNYKSQWKKYQITEIIAEETYHMEHVYVCTYKTAGAPDLPAELAEHAPKWEKEMIAHAQATPVPAPVQEVKLNTPANPEPEPARKSAPKPATRKPRHAVKIDDSRQILIQFDDEQTPAPESTPVKTKARRTHKPRVKRDYSRQILIDFGENIPDSQTNQRKAA